MTRREFEAKWQEEEERFRRRHAQVDGAALVEELLSDFHAVIVEGGEELLNLQQASRESGYSPDHLGRLVRSGRISNAGRRCAPRIRRRDLPRKAGALQRRRKPRTLLCATPGQIARAVVASEEGEAR